MWLSSTEFKSKFEVERKDNDGYNCSAAISSQQPHPSPLLPTPPHPFSSSAGVSGAGGVPVATPAHMPDSTTDSWSGYYGAQRQDGIKPFGNKNMSLKQRCRNYDGRNDDSCRLKPFVFHLRSFYQSHTPHRSTEIVQGFNLSLVSLSLNNFITGPSP